MKPRKADPKIYCRQCSDPLALVDGFGVCLNGCGGLRLLNRDEVKRLKQSGREIVQSKSMRGIDTHTHTHTHKEG